MFIEITNAPRDYAWGSTSAMAELLGREPSGAPEAELWLGTHPASPARLADGSGTLEQVTGGPLPFLVKVLAASAPLSLQAHPDAAQARDGFARENAAGLAPDAPERNYRDASPKPELIYALSDPFRALCGFRAVAETRAVLQAAASDPRVAPLQARLVDDGSLRPVVEWLVGGGDGVDDLVAGLAEAAERLDGPSWDTVRRLSAHHPGDPGVAVSMLLHSVALRPGEALYLPAGNIHAYLEGVGVEVMASSDNVLRGGLTAKHVDVPELLRVLDIAPRPVPYLRPEAVEDGVSAFRPDAPDFVLTVVADAALRRGVDLPLGGRAAILLCTSGAVTASGAELARGGAAYVAGEETLRLSGHGLLFVASTGS